MRTRAFPAEHIPMPCLAKTKYPTAMDGVLCGKKRVLPISIRHTVFFSKAERCPVLHLTTGTS
jgi:hypothetical protein